MNGHKRPTVPVAEFAGEAITVVAMHQAVAPTTILPLPFPAMAAGSHFI